MLYLSEIFHSIQGEGGLTGTPSVFVRTSGCNLRCWFCDTPYTSWDPEGWREEWQVTVDKVREFDCEHAVLTGGEPLLQPEVVAFTEALTSAGHHITIETAGTVYRPVKAGLISLSPKLSNSVPSVEHHATAGKWIDRHDTTRDQPEVVRQLTTEYEYQVKFVVHDKSDLDEIQTWLSKYPHIEHSRVFLMPQARTNEELTQKRDWLESLSEEYGFQFSNRLHIELWGNVRGK
ncbi:7-carboxy-7-deazaguanine synthase QueE [Calycomorphotria hydatis]|uniref:7-carboxy-7-deazaguanine synthase n=1 Tax=Calycomorphotria hydatis TaxID=2528027 RepID=A0A517T569_9PLAN|nr:7-carboxy-7-deazaguanine synthase QueE [Calycomorphotria hydatis]QDT63514.1 7-carboxy-7-deazaguanine synthase [Calycomorphotria hydatis]